MNCDAIVEVIPTSKCGDPAKYRIAHESPRRTLFACGIPGHLEQLVEAALEFDPVLRVAKAGLLNVPEVAR